MIGAFQRIRHVGMLAALAAGLSALPNMGQQRTLGLRPGSGIVRRDGPAPKRRDSARQAAAQAKRERKGAKRMRDWHACLAHGIPGRWTAWPHPWEASHGQ